LRIGPYISGEWTYGGLPVWLNQIPNISFRSNNDAWKRLMQWWSKNGGPIIVAQIENEYSGNDHAYVDWCGSLVNNELSSTEIP
ncbi:unnamed protein product, partial [Rotaria socialis]